MDLSNRYRYGERGFLVPLALFIVVSLASIAIAVSRMTSSARVSVVDDAISVQAFYAAETGAQLAMHQIYFNASDRTATDANCIALDGSSMNLTGTGFTGCSLALACDRTVDTGDIVSLYELTSEASCGSNDMQLDRTISVSAYMR